MNAHRNPDEIQPQRTAPRGSSSAIEAAASAWLLRREAGLAAAEERELAAWRAADPRHAATFARLEGVAAVFDRAQRHGAATAIVTRLEIRARQRRHRRQAMRAVAASAAVVLAAALLWTWRGGDQVPAMPTSAEVASELVRKLPDGSIVELNTGADISVQYEAAVRRVRLLRGEAHFRVEKDAARPFLVQAGGVEVRAVGTAFTVQLQSRAVEVVVTEGRVAVEKVPLPVAAVAAPDAPGLAAGEVPAVAAPAPVDAVPLAYVDAGNRVLVDLAPKPDVAPEIKPMTAIQLDERLAWRLPRLEFGGMELGQAVALMNRTNRLQIAMGDATVGSLRISGVFRADNPEGFVRIVEGAFGLEAEHRGDHEIVLRKAR